MGLDVIALLLVIAVVSISAVFAVRHRKGISAGKQKELLEEAIRSASEPAEEQRKDSVESSAMDSIEALKDEASSAPEEKTVEEPQELDQAPTLEKIEDVAEESHQQSESTVSLESALSNTKKGFWGRIQKLFSGGEDVDLDSIEEVLYTSDLGPTTVQHLLSVIEEKMPKAEMADIEKVRQAIRTEMMEMLDSVQGEDEEQLAGLEYELLDDNEEVITPVVWMIVGVNGSGKTTSIGKLAHTLAGEGKKVMLAAGDTFRAAADAQLREWSKRADVELFSPENVKDPSAVAFDACKSALSKGYDHVIVDTAGRLHTQSNLMEELKKMKRVVDKAIPGAPHEVILVVDGNNGQNALLQAKEFNNAVDLTGVILTKMDGSAKGGVVLGVAHELKLPIKRIGVGEKIEDLRSFNSKEFVDAII